MIWKQNARMQLPFILKNSVTNFEYIKKNHFIYSGAWIILSKDNPRGRLSLPVCQHIDKEPVMSDGWLAKMEEVLIDAMLRYL